MKQFITISHQSFATTVFNINSWQKKLLTTSIATVVMAIAANVSIPLQPVPFTFQSLAVLLIGAFLGRNLGALALIQYMLAGAVGLPVFANGAGGIAALMSPSAGYIYGFVLSAYVAGFAAEKGFDRKFITGVLAFAVAHIIIFVFGVSYLTVYLNGDFYKALQVGYFPFVGFDVLKFVFATLTMIALWRYRARKQK